MAATSQLASLIRYRFQRSDQTFFIVVPPLAPVCCYSQNTCRDAHLTAELGTEMVHELLFKSSVGCCLL